MAVEKEVDSNGQYEQCRTGGCDAEVEYFATSVSLQLLDCLGYLLPASCVFAFLLQC